MTLLPLLILAIHSAASVEAELPGAVTVFHCVFDNSWDENFDGWPDNWTRRTGRGYPPYIEIKISNEPSPAGNRCLRINLDGAGAVAYSPLIEVGCLYGYLLQGELKTENLVHDRAFFSVTFLDQERRRLATHHSEGIRQSDGWRSIRLGPLEPTDKEVAYAVIGLHVEPQEREDLKGAAVFDDIRFIRLPRLSLSTERRHNVFDDPKQIEIQCEASGFMATRPKVVFRLEDIEGRELAKAEEVLTARRATGGVPQQFGSSETSIARRVVASWKPPVPGPGFYRVHADLTGDAAKCSSSIALVVVDAAQDASGEFGWSLPRGGRPLPLVSLDELLDQVGIRWLKYPLWYGQNASEESVEELVRFSERLSSRGITLVGLLDNPPQELQGHFAEEDRLVAAEIFTRQPSEWYPSLEPVLTRLSTRVGWWQLGRDDDASFVGCAGLNGKLAKIKSEMDRVALDVNLGIAWNLTDKPPRCDESALRFLALACGANLTPKELTTCLNHPDSKDATKEPTHEPSVARWVTIEPLAREGQSVQVRAGDLVRRMMAAKIAGADAIFAADPFDPIHGLLHEDGTPTELLLPWRTTALVLGEGRHLGGIELPRGSTNEVFVRSGEAVMVVWNEKPREESLFLGDNARQVDAWGRPIASRKDGHRQVISVGPMPTFLTGLNVPIAQWRKDLVLVTANVPSTPGHPHRNAFRVTNTFPCAASVRAQVIIPDKWRAEPSQAIFTLNPQGQHEHPFEIALPYDVSNGEYPLRIDFEIHADRDYRFSVFRRLGVGLDGVKIEHQTAINAEGQLVVTQRIVNSGKTRVSFRCQLIAPGRQRQETHVVRLPPGMKETTYFLPDGAELIGKTLWLRAEELDGNRKLNIPFVVEK